MEWSSRARQSPSGSHRSQDSGFSDSECAGHNSSPPSRVKERRSQLTRRKSKPSGANAPSPVDEAPQKQLPAASQSAESSQSLTKQHEDSSSVRDGTCNITAKFMGSCDDLRNLPPPAHASTPKSLGRTRMSVNDTVVPRCAVTFWLDELRFTYDPECMSTLQSKSLMSELSKQVSQKTAIVAGVIKQVHRKTTQVTADVYALYRLIIQGETRDNEVIVKRLIKLMDELQSNYPLDHGNSRSATLRDVCASFRNTLKNMSIEDIKFSIKSLVTAFSQMVDDILLNQLKILVDILETHSLKPSLLCTISAIADLELKASYLGDLLAKCAGITALLEICITNRSSAVRASALRVLATVCCTPSSINQFEKGGGVDIICDLLSDKMKSDSELSEAVSVIVQVTAPWLEHGHTVHNLEHHLIPLISSLTRIISETKSSEAQLLCAAALANISWAEPRSVWPLVYNNSVGTLLKVVRSQGTKASVFLKEQVATVLANMSAVGEVRPHLTKNRIVPALLCFLHVPQSPLLPPAEVAAGYRVQHKAAIALSRLCSEPEVAVQVVELQGIPRLTRLCKDEKERNNNNGTLAACLAALRKITTSCGRNVIDGLNAKDLVDPKLLDSFQLYSKGNSTYLENIIPE